MIACLCLADCVGDRRKPASDALHAPEPHIDRTSYLFSVVFSFPSLPITRPSVSMMRRDRLFLAATLTAIFSADFYFILLPKLRSLGHTSGDLCTCGHSNLTLPVQGGLATPQLSNWTSVLLLDGSTPEPADGGSKLGRLFAHPLYNIQTPALGPEERLLQAEQLIEYYRKKVSRWER